MPQESAISAALRPLTSPGDCCDTLQEIQEGNIVEAGILAGVEEADDQDKEEVHLHEAPEDDVTDEYWEND